MQSNIHNVKQIEITNQNLKDDHWVTTITVTHVAGGRNEDGRYRHYETKTAIDLHSHGEGPVPVTTEEAEIARLRALLGELPTDAPCPECGSLPYNPGCDQCNDEKAQEGMRLDEEMENADSCGCGAKLYPDQTACAECSGEVVDGVLANPSVRLLKQVAAMTGGCKNCGQPDELHTVHDDGSVLCPTPHGSR